MNNFFGFNNKYGRPIPYVWFLIIAVSSVPQILMGSILEEVQCTQTVILNGRTTEQYLKEKGFTIDNAVTKCSELTALMPWIAKGVSCMIGLVMIWTLKPWPLSSIQKESKKPWKALPKKQNTKRRKSIS